MTAIRGWRSMCFSGGLMAKLISDENVTHDFQRRALTLMTPRGHIPGMQSAKSATKVAFSTKKMLP